MSAVLRNVWAGAVAILIAGSWGGRASGQRSPTTSAVLQLSGCTSARTASQRMLYALKTELRHEGVREFVKTPHPDSLVVDIDFDCDPRSPYVRLLVRDPRLAPSLRTVDLGDIEPALVPRAIALATAELVRSTWLGGKLGESEGRAAQSGAVRNRPRAPDATSAANAPTPTPTSGETPAQPEPQRRIAQPEPRRMPQPEPQGAGVGSQSQESRIEPQSPDVREAANREAANREAANREAANREAANREAANREGGRVAQSPESSARSLPAQKPTAATPHSPPSKESAERLSAETQITTSKSAGLLLLLGGDMRVFLESPQPFFGGHFAAQLWRARAGAEVLTSARDDRLGEASFSVLALFASIEAFTREGRYLTWSLAPRGAVGRATAMGTAGASSQPSTTVVEPYVDGAVELRMQANPLRAVRLEASAAIGYATGLTALADTRIVGKIGGPCATIGLALALNAAQPRASSDRR